jgi:hypothetical protein
MTNESTLAQSFTRQAFRKTRIGRTLSAAALVDELRFRTSWAASTHFFVTAGNC